MTYCTVRADTPKISAIREGYTFRICSSLAVMCRASTISAFRDLESMDSFGTSSSSSTVSRILSASSAIFDMIMMVLCGDKNKTLRPALLRYMSDYSYSPCDVRRFLLSEPFRFGRRKTVRGCRGYFTARLGGSNFNTCSLLFGGLRPRSSPRPEAPPA